MPPSKKVDRRALDRAESALRDAGLSWPAVTEHFPWGHRTLKVKGKAFVFMGGDDQAWTLSVKLPNTGLAALDFPFAAPTGYGLGKSGWVTASFPPSDEPPTDLLLAWLRESYEAVAPRRLLAAEEAAAGKARANAEKKTSESKTATKKTATKKAAATKREAKPRTFAKSATPGRQAAPGGPTARSKSSSGGARKTVSKAPSAGRSTGARKSKRIPSAPRSA